MAMARSQTPPVRWTPGRPFGTAQTGPCLQAAPPSYCPARFQDGILDQQEVLCAKLNVENVILTKYATNHGASTLKGYYSTLPPLMPWLPKVPGQCELGLSGWPFGQWQESSRIDGRTCGTSLHHKSARVISIQSDLNPRPESLPAW
eukprot:symbB.v1.2.036068.t1/scaffold5008.1/size31855/2